MLDRFKRSTDEDPQPAWLIEYAGDPIDSIKTAWNTMLRELKLPMTDDYKPYVIRRSMATILRQQGGVDPWQLSGQMGHRLLDTTEIYAILSPSYLGTVQLGIQEVIDRILDRVPEAALHRSSTGDTKIRGLSRAA